MGLLKNKIDTRKLIDIECSTNFVIKNTYSDVFILA